MELAIAVPRTTSSRTTHPDSLQRVARLGVTCDSLNLANHPRVVVRVKAFSSSWSVVSLRSQPPHGQLRTDACWASFATKRKGVNRNSPCVHPIAHLPFVPSRSAQQDIALDAHRGPCNTSPTRMTNAGSTARSAAAPRTRALSSATQWNNPNDVGLSLSLSWVGRDMHKPTGLASDNCRLPRTESECKAKIAHFVPRNVGNPRLRGSQSFS